MGMMILQLGLFLGVLLLCAFFLSAYLAKVIEGRRVLLTGILEPVEDFLYRIFSVDKGKGTGVWEYILNVLVFSVIGIIFVFVLQLLQGFLPFNPMKMTAVRWDTAFNTAVSFVTNTNWQSYNPENTMSYFTQMFGLAVQNFLSAAVGIAVFMAFVRGFVKQNSDEIGNFWVDLIKAILYVLLPFSVILALFFVSQGVVQNFSEYLNIKTLEGAGQVLAQGPVASQLAIKLFGTNGGGFFSVNSAHPFENPNALTDYIEILSILAISAALPLTFGVLLKNRKQGWVIFLTMFVLFTLGLVAMMKFETALNPSLEQLGVQNGVNMLGKETRFGVLNSVTFAQTTTATSCGAVNSMHESFMPLSGMVLLFNMMVGEVVFGGVGTGFVGFVLYAILTMFLVGLMIGRTPEIFGKKLEPREMGLAVAAIILPSIVQLVLGAIALSAETAPGMPLMYRLSEILYAFASAAGNNGSSFTGLDSGTVFYNLATAFAMLVGRFGLIIFALLISASLMKKRFVPAESRFPSDEPIFGVLVLGVIVVAGALTFFPVIVLAPILEHFLHFAGMAF